MPWGYTLGHVLVRDFTVQTPTTGGLVDADSLPTGVLVRNGVDSAEVVSVVNKGTGLYTATVTIPTGWTIGDDVGLRIAATVGGVSSARVIWQTLLVSATQLLLGPLVASARAGNRVGSPLELEIFQQEAKDFVLTILDADSNPVDLTGSTYRFVVHNDDGEGLFEVENANIAISGDNNEIATVSVNSTNSNQVVGAYEWRFWNVTTEQVMLYGPLTILTALADIA